MLRRVARPTPATGPVGRLSVVACVAALAVGIVVASAQADSSPVSVNAPLCSLFQGGHSSVPAGSTINFHAGLAEQTLGILTAVLRAQATSVSWSLNGGPSSAVVDLSGSWTSPTQRPDGAWLSTNDYLPGLTHAAGDVLTITYSETLSHVVPEVFNPAGGARQASRRSISRTQPRLHALSRRRDEVTTEQSC